MLQYAIRQSLGDNNSTSGEQSEQVDIWEALEALPPGHNSRLNIQGEDRLLQQAIEVNISKLLQLKIFSLQASMQDMNVNDRVSPQQQPQSDHVVDDGEDDMSRALRLSLEQETLRQEKMRDEEEEMLRQVLEQSLKEK